MNTLAISLLLAHLVGDFVLQPDTLVKQKTRQGRRSPYLLLHVLIHAALIALLLGRQIPEYIHALWVIPLSHWSIDALKLELRGRFSEPLLFLADQLAHLLMIAWVVMYYTPVDTAFLREVDWRLWAVALIALTRASDFLLQAVLGRWSGALDEIAGLPGAGRFIGWLERLLIFGFILLGQWAAIGWLLAAKSIFRFGDLSRASDRKLTEYVLVGTLLSFTLAVLLGYTFLQLVPASP